MLYIVKGRLGKILPNPPASNPCIAQLSGFSLHAGTRCRAHERDSLERLCRYIARPALSNERLSVNDRRQVVYRLKHPLRTEAESEADPASLADIPQLPTNASSREGRLFLPYRRYSDRIATPPYSLGGFR